MEGLILSDDRAVGDALRQVLNQQGGVGGWEVWSSTREGDEIAPELRSAVSSLRQVLLYSHNPEQRLDWLYDLRCLAQYRHSCVLVSRSIAGAPHAQRALHEQEERLSRLFHPPLSRCQVGVSLFPLRGVLDAVLTPGTATYHQMRVAQRRARWLRSRISH